MLNCGKFSQKSVSVLKGMGPEIQWLHSWVTGDKVSMRSIVNQFAHGVHLKSD